MIVSPADLNNWETKVSLLPEVKDTLRYFIHSVLCLLAASTSVWKIWPTWQWLNRLSCGQCSRLETQIRPGCNVCECQRTLSSLSFLPHIFDQDPFLFFCYVLSHALGVRFHIPLTTIHIVDLYSLAKWKTALFMKGTQQDNRFVASQAWHA